MHAGFARSKFDPRHDGAALLSAQAELIVGHWSCLQEFRSMPSWTGPGDGPSNAYTTRTSRSLKIDQTSLHQPKALLA